MDDIRTVIERGIAGLAAVCDHAQSLDQQGFSASTAPKGHEIANLPDRHWSERVETVALSILKRHRQQLVTLGCLTEDELALVDRNAGGTVDPDAIPDLWIARDPQSGRFVVSAPDRRLRSRLKECEAALQPAGRGKIWTLPPEAAHVFVEIDLSAFDVDADTKSRLQSAIQSADQDRVSELATRLLDFRADGHFIFRFPYDRDLVGLMRDAGGRFDREAMTWVIPDSQQARQLADQVVSEEFTVTQRAVAQRETLVPPPIPVQRRGTASAPLLEVIGHGDDVEIKMSPYVEDWKNAIKSLPASERRWDPDKKAWMVKADPETLSILAGRLSLSFSPPSAEALSLLSPEIERDHEETIVAGHTDLPLAP